MRIRRDFKSQWRNYVYQTLLATVVLVIVLSLLTVANAVVIASIGATAFMVFTMPSIASARPRRVVGGHIVGLCVGSLCAMIPHPSAFLSIVVLSIAVGISMFLMIVFEIEHPPAAGTALGVAITGFSIGVMVAVLISSMVLSFSQRYSSKLWKNLT